jgi:hypothetical protein
MREMHKLRASHLMPRTITVTPVVVITAATAILVAFIKYAYHYHKHHHKHHHHHIHANHVTTTTTTTVGFTPTNTTHNQHLLVLAPRSTRPLVCLYLCLIPSTIESRYTLGVKLFHGDGVPEDKAEAGVCLSS